MVNIGKNKTGVLVFDFKGIYLLGQVWYISYLKYFLYMFHYISNASRFTHLDNTQPVRGVNKLYRAEIVNLIKYASDLLIAKVGGGGVSGQFLWPPRTLS